MSKLCIKCGEYPVKNTSTSRSYCKECSKAYERDRWNKMPHQKRAEKALKRVYGITFDEYENLVALQDYKCATCLVPVTTEPGQLKGVVDHCHNTLRIRGILCNQCNKALGLVYDNVETLRRMCTYLNVR